MKKTSPSLRALCCALLAGTSMFAAAPSQVQAPAEPIYHQTLSLVRVEPGKSSGFLQFTRDTTKKVAQARADAGEIVAWALLRSVYPSGQEARANYMFSTIVAGPPAPPMNSETFDKWLKKVGVNTPAAEWMTQRNSHSTLVANEVWRIRERLGAPREGHYVRLNLIKMNDSAAYIEFNRSTWRPMAEEWIRRGDQSGRLFATKVFPAGTEAPYGAYTSTVYPTWEAVFKSPGVQAVFERVHPGKNYAEFSAHNSKIRDLSRVELWVIVDRVEKK